MPDDIEKKEKKNGEKEMRCTVSSKIWLEMYNVFYDMYKVI